MGILLSERFQRGRRFSRYVDLRRTQGGGRGGGRAHMYVPPQRVWFWGHSGLESGMVFEGTTEACERKEKKSPDRRLACIVLIPNERTK